MPFPGISPLSLRWVHRSTSNAKPKRPLVPQPRSKHAKRRPLVPPSNEPLHVRRNSVLLQNKPLPSRQPPQPRPSKRPSRSKRLLPMRRRLRLR